MTGEGDRDLPLHDEARARSKWRGDETILDKGDLGTAGPASEVDESAQDGQQGPGGPADTATRNLAQSPPD